MFQILTLQLLKNMNIILSVLKPKLYNNKNTELQGKERRKLLKTDKLKLYQPTERIKDEYHMLNIL